MQARAVRRTLGGLALAGALLIGPAAVPAGAGQGSGNPVLTVSPASLGTGGGTVTVSGGDYLVPPHAPGANVFGGVYLFFGWVRPGAWGPSIRTSSSNDGNFGVTYSYAGDGGDGSTRDDGSGRMRLISFTPGGDSGTATPFHMDDNGNWSTTLAIPGSAFQFVDPASGRPVTVNCRLVQCGVFTIGAHGKASATNERFAPISFTGGAPLPPSSGAPGPGGGSVAPAGDLGGGGEAPDPAATPGATAAGPTTPLPSAATPPVASSTTTSSRPSAEVEDSRTAREEQVALSNTSDSKSGGGTSTGLVIAAAIVLVLLAGAAGWWFWFRHRGSPA